MRWYLACALLMVAGCGEPVEGQGTTFVSITMPGPDVIPETWFSCWSRSPTAAHVSCGERDLA